MRIVSIILLLSSLFTLQACVSAPGSKTDTLKIEHSNRDDVNVALIPAEYREVYFSSADSVERHCRAPGPDFTVQQGINFSLGANIGGNSENAGVGESQSAMGLGGRSATVLIIRELMYRACELTTNINADHDSTLETYNRFLDVMVSVTDAHLDTGVSASDSSIAVTPEINLPDNNSDSSSEDDTSYSEDGS